MIARYAKGIAKLVKNRNFKGVLKSTRSLARKGMTIARKKGGVLASRVKEIKSKRGMSGLGEEAKLAGGRMLKRGKEAAIRGREAASGRLKKSSKLVQDKIAEVKKMSKPERMAELKKTGEAMRKRLASKQAQLTKSMKEGKLAAAKRTVKREKVDLIRSARKSR